MIINITDKIYYAMYGNECNTICVLDKIKNNQKQKNSELEINNENLKYYHNNTDSKYLILKINENTFFFNENDKITFEYDMFKNNIKIIIVRTEKHLYWDDWYKNIIKYYPNNKIYVIYNYKLNKPEELPDNINIIENNIFNKGIYLAYYYILKNKLNGKFLILDDRIIINKIFDDTKINKSLFTFEHKWKIDDKYIFDLLNALNNSERLYLEYENLSWKGIFKSMTIITSEVLNKINDKHNLEYLINAINNNQYEMAFERILGILLYNETNESNSIFGDIHQELEKNHNPWNFTYDKYVISKKDKYFNYIFK